MSFRTSSQLLVPLFPVLNKDEIVEKHEQLSRLDDARRLMQVGASIICRLQFLMMSSIGFPCSWPSAGLWPVIPACQLYAGGPRTGTEVWYRARIKRAGDTAHQCACRTLATHAVCSGATTTERMQITTALVPGCLFQQATQPPATLMFQPKVPRALSVCQRDASVKAVPLLLPL